MKKSFSIPDRSLNDAKALIFEPTSPWLAPLAGYSDLPFRLLCRELGAKVCETEMISAKGLNYKTPASAELLASNSADYPLVVQLFGSDPADMANAIQTLRQHGYTAFDCNMGCPVRKVLRQKCGAALLNNPEQALAVAEAMLNAAKNYDFPPAVVGFKFRLDPEHKEDFVRDFGRKLEDLGASWLTLHPRTAQQGFSGKADWKEIAKLTKAVGIPVIASGDLLSANDAADCLHQTGADCVMYGRASLRNPFVFQQHTPALAKRSLPELTLLGLCELILRHINLAREYNGERRAFVKMRSIIPRYVRQLAGVNRLRLLLCSCESWESLEKALIEFLERENESNQG